MHNLWFNVGGILSSTHWGKFPVSLGNHVGFTPPNLTNRTHQPPIGITQLKTGWAQAAWLWWLCENCFFHLDISRCLKPCGFLWDLPFFWTRRQVPLAALEPGIATMMMVRTRITRIPHLGIIFLPFQSRFFRFSWFNDVFFPHELRQPYPPRVYQRMPNWNRGAF